MKKAGKWIVNVISILLMLLILCAALALFTAKLNNKPVFLFGRAAVWILTPSMEPDIPAGSYILIKRVEAADVAVGDVIMFYSDDPALGGAFNTHRVTEIIGDHEAFVTKGDNNPTADPVPAAGDKVVGQYVRNMPLMTLLGRLFRSVAGLIILFGLTILSVVVTFAGRRGENKKKTKQGDFDALVAAEVERLRAADRKAIPPEPTDPTNTLENIPAGATDENAPTHHEK